MPDQQKSDQQKSKIAEEAADLFLRLSSDPENPNLLAERDAFCARGAIEKKAFEAVRKAWTGVKPVEPRRKTPMVLLAVALGCAAYMAYEPIRTVMLADYRTQRAPETVVLTSGDQIDMDASTALRDRSSSQERRFTVLDGAALFDVESEARPFLVDIGPISVRVTGTIFETAYQGDAFSVSVIEGEVEVSLDSQSWQLTEGMGFTWSDEVGIQIQTYPADDIASWRQDRFVMNDLLFREVVSVIERRLAGPVLIVNDALAAQPVSGIVDLADPMLALQTLAASREARVLRLGPLATLISR